MPAASPSGGAVNPGENRRLLRIASGLALAALAFHLYANRGYGYFRDELYYIACGEHLAAGYPDHAPLIGVYAWLSRALLGDSLSAIRLLPAMAGAAEVFLTGLLTMEFGGGAAAVAIACTAVLCAPIRLVMDNMLTMNAFEPVFWLGVVYFAVRARRAPGNWFWAGVFAGLGIENKHSTVFFLAALFAGLMLAREWRVLRERWLWVGLAAALALALPNLIWQAANHFPTLELLGNVRATGKNVVLGPVDFAAQQLLLNGVAAIVAAAGVAWLFRRQRWLGWTFAAFFVLMFAMKAKNYYVAPIYPFVLAAGGMWWAERARWLQWTALASLAVVTVPLAWLALPVLPVETLIAWQQASPLKIPKSEVAHAGPLPQHLGDQFGWPEMAAEVARVYHSLPEEERIQAGILANNYGEAGAIDFFGPKLGLPKSISPHQSYWLWGPRDYSGAVLIVLAGDSRRLQMQCGSTELAGRFGHKYAMAEEHKNVYVCRGLKTPLAQLWPALKVWN